MIILASPQKENGYTPIANEILDQLVKLSLNGTQLRIVIVVWRYTYGFSRRQHNLSINFILKAMGLQKTQYKQVSREIKKLFDIGLLHEVSKSDDKTRVISFNKNYDLWTNKSSGLIRLEDKIDQREGTKKTREPLDELDPQDKQGKTNIKITFDADEIQYKLAALLRKGILENLPKAKVPDDKELNKWASVIDKMMRLDNRSTDEIKEVITFSVKDPFWSSNILSAGSLREKFDRLTAQVNRTKKHKPIETLKQAVNEGVYTF